MKKYLLHLFVVGLFLLFSNILYANFGVFASAVYINNTYYNLTYDNTSVAVGSTSLDFQGINLGTFDQYSGGLIFQGGQIRTWKDSNGNVCGGKVYYRYYKTSVSPVAAFSSINLQFGSNCGDIEYFTTSCNFGDQIWKIENGSEDLTNLCPGDYYLEVYIEVNGNQSGSGGCGNSYWISNSGSNYKATFTINSTLSVTTQDQEVCAGSTLSLNATPSGGNNASYTYSWIGPNSFSSPDANPLINNAQTSDSGIYQVQVTDGCGSTLTENLNVTVNPLPVTNPINPL